MAEIAGLKLIVPSSVAGSGVSVSASGKVTFTAATSVSVNGCFTSAHDNFLIVMRFVGTATSGGPGLQARLRAGGSDNSTASSYTSQYIEAGGTSVAGNRATDNLTKIGDASQTQRSGYHIYVYGPYLAQPTAGRSVSAGGASSAFISDVAFTHNQSTSYDGITIFPTAAALTGALCVYGLAQ